MTMDVSSLAVEVTSSGIKEASTALGGLSRSAGTASDKVTTLTERLGNLLAVMPGTTSGANGLSGVMGLVATAMANISATALSATSALAKTSEAMQTLTKATNQQVDSFQKYTHHGHVFSNTLKAMATAALAYFSIASARNIIEQADAWGMMQAKLRIATGSMQEAKEVQQRLFDLSQNLRAPLEDMGKLYTRLATALGRMGKSSEDTRNMVEGVTLALKLGGATSAEAASTMLQFSQAANAGRLNGAEFNSVAENGVMILRALEDHLGKNQAQLKKMGSEGKLTFDLISDALEAQLPKWREEFAKLPVTFEGGMTRIKNAWFKAIGEAGQETELGKKLAELLLKIEADVPRVAKVVVDVLTSITDHSKLLTNVLGTLLALGLVKWALEAGAAFVTLSRGIAAAGGAAAVARTGLAAMAGPVGVVIGVLGVAATAWTLFGNESKKSSEDLTDKVRVDVSKRIAEIERETEKLRERNREEAGGKKPKDKVARQSDAVAQALKNFEDLRTEQQSTTPGLAALLQAEVNAAAAQYARLATAEHVFKEEQNITEERRKQTSLEELNKAARKKYGGKDDRVALAIESEKELYAAKGLELPKDVEKMIREKILKAGEKAVTEAEKQRKAADEARLSVEKLGESVDFATAKMREHQSSVEKVSAAESELFKINKIVKQTTDEKALATLNAAKAELEVIRGKEHVKIALTEEIRAREEAVKAQHGQQQAAEKELATLDDKIVAYGKAAGSMDDYGLAAAQAKLSTMQMFDDGSDKNGEIERQKGIIAVLEEVRLKKEELGQLELGDKLTKDLAALKPADFGTAFADAFGSIGTAIDKAGKALDAYNKKMNRLAEVRKDALKATDETKRNSVIKKLQKEETEAELDKYGAMAGAVKQFFGEKTVAYKAFDAIEEGLRIARLASDAAEFANKIANGAEWIAVKVAQAYTAMTTDATVTATSVANSGAVSVASTAAGVAKAFEQMGVWGFAGAAAIIAFMASMGVGGGGGGGGVDISAARQKSQGTGTILGDDDAKSASLFKSLERLKDNSNIGLTHTAEMSMYLRSIDSKTGNLTTSISRVKGMTSGENFGGLSNSLDRGALGFTGLNALGGVFSSSVRESVADTGLLIRGKLDDIKTSQYLDVNRREESSGFFGIGGSSSDSQYRKTQGVEERISESIASVFKDVKASLISAGKVLGADPQGLTAQLDRASISKELSIKGLKGKELEEAIAATLSAAADDLAAVNMPWMKEFQRTGEGMFETVVRVASGVETANNALEGLGITAASYQAVLNKTGDVDAEVVRISILSKEAGTSLSKVFEVLDGSMEDLVSSYMELTRLRSSMKSLGLGDNVSLDLIRGAGGVQELSDAFGDYLDNFYSDADRAKSGIANLKMEFGRLNVAVPASKDAFKALVVSLMAGDAASQELAGRILSLSGEWATVMDDVESAVASSRGALQDAYDKEAEALRNTQEQMQQFTDSLEEFKASLLLGDLSTKSTLDKYQTAYNSYGDVSARAMSGDTAAIEAFQKTAEEFLNLSRVVNASGVNYTADYDRVLRETEALEAFTKSKADTAAASLDLLTKQVDALLKVDESVKSVEQAIRDLATAVDISSAPTLGLEERGPKYYRNPGDPLPWFSNHSESGFPTGWSNLGASLADLREEVAGLRADQAAQTAVLVDASYGSASANADAVSASQQAAATDAQWASSFDSSGSLF